MQDHLPHLRQRPAHREPSNRDIGDGGDQQEDLVLHPSLVPGEAGGPEQGPLQDVSLHSHEECHHPAKREIHSQTDPGHHSKTGDNILYKKKTEQFFLLYVQTPKIAGNLFKGELNFSR